MIPFGMNPDLIWRAGMDRYVTITRRLRSGDPRYRAWEKRADAFGKLTRETNYDVEIERRRCSWVDTLGPRPIGHPRRAKGWLA